MSTPPPALPLNTQVTIHKLTTTDKSATVEVTVNGKRQTETLTPQDTSVLSAEGRAFSQVQMVAKMFFRPDGEPKNGNAPTLSLGQLPEMARKLINEKFSAPTA